MSKPSLVPSEKCSGCSACQQICPQNAISMIANEEGFLHPVIDSVKCVECGLCEKICPAREKVLFNTLPEYPKVYAVKHKNNNVREASTSGGLFTAISDYVLQQHGVVFGVIYDENMNIVHSKATNEIERNAMRGSKYVQSNLQNVFNEVKEALDADRYVLFTGTPCQNAGLKSFLQITNTDSTNLYLCDIICHGVSSPLFWKEFVNFLEKKYSDKLTNYNFRSQWQGNHARANFQHGQVVEDTSDVLLLLLLFYYHTILRPSCHSCPYATTQRIADITIGDFWGIEKTKPDFVDNLGVSLCIVNNTKGEQLFNKIQSNLDCEKSDVPSCTLPGVQIQLKRPAQPSKNRERFWLQYRKFGFEYVASRYGNYCPYRGFRKLLWILNRKHRNCIPWILNKIKYVLNNIHK